MVINKKVLSIFITSALALPFLQNVAIAQIKSEEFAEAMKQYLATDAGREAVGGSIEKYFIDKQQANAKEQEEAMWKNRVKIEAGSSPSKGPQNAPITIIEFSDFECPFCSRGRTVVDQVLKAYPDKVKLVFKQLPLEMHANARDAAKAALAAQKQGKFWEFHDALFDNQQSLSDAFYKEQAKKLGLDMAKWEKDRTSTEVEQAIKDDEKQAQSADIRGTPGFILNGVVVRGAQPVELFNKVVDRLLKE
jgi:protein-disulfide isomerase